MFVVSKRNIILPGPNGEKFRMAKDYMGPVPAWAEDSAYLRALEKDGKVIITASSKDKDIDAASKRGKRSGRKPPEPPRDPSQELQPPEEGSEEETAPPEDES